MTDRPVRFGLIGFGLFGKHHADAINNGELSELAAVAVKSTASQTDARERYPHVEVCADYRELLARDDIEVVSVVVPNVLHFEVGRAVLTAGKHLLLEKPMAIGLAQCDQLIALADQKNRILAVGHELRLSSLWGGAKRLIDEGAIGRVQHVLIELSRFPYRQGSEGWRYDKTRVGNWILEEPIHFFDLARWYLADAGEPVSIYARANSRSPDRPELLDNFSATVNFHDDAYAVISQTLAAFGHHQTAKIVGTRGTIWAYWSAADARSAQSRFGLTYGLGDDVQQLALEKPAGELLELADQIQAVAHCVRTGAPPPCSGKDGRASSLLCLAANRSIATGEIIAIDKFIDEADVSE